MTARGESVLRLEDERLLRGAGCFTADIRLENELRMFVVRSPHAAARIVSIETSDAVRRPGVIAVLTGRDSDDLLATIRRAIRQRSSKPPA